MILIAPKTLISKSFLKSSSVNLPKGFRLMLPGANPLNKYSYFNKGKKLLEDAIKKEPNNIEIRLMRLISQEKTPSFLGYNKNIESDRNFIIKNYKNSDDENLVKLIKNYLKI